jgi:hypothetical protein
VLRREVLLREAFSVERLDASPLLGVAMDGDDADADDILDADDDDNNPTAAGFD